MHHQDSAPATSLDLLNMLAAGLGAGMPQPIAMGVRHYEACVHTDTAADAATWEQYWRNHGAHGWRWRDSDTRDYEHHHRIGTWRNATVDIVHLTPTEQPAEEVVPV